MKLSTKSRYGTRALLDIALNANSGPVAIENISVRQGISKKYLEHLLRALKAAGILKSVRGAHGGYLLSREPNKITLLEIVETLEGTIQTVHCVDDPSLCHRIDICVTRDVWSSLADGISDLLRSYTLETLVENHNKKQSNFNYII